MRPPHSAAARVVAPQGGLLALGRPGGAHVPLLSAAVRVVGAGQPLQRARRSLGFTLIELLVALAVMSMLAILSWRSIDGMNRTQTLTQQRSDELLRLQAALGQWNADLDALVDTDELNPLEFDGKLLRMTRRDSSENALQSAGVRVVAWARMNQAESASSQWMRWQSAPVRRRDELAQAWQRAAEWAASGSASKAADRRDSAVSLEGIDQWQLFYHRGETWGNPLSSVGNETPGSNTSADATVPNGVRLVLTLTAGQGLAGTVVRDWVRPTLQSGPQ